MIPYTKEHNQPHHTGEQLKHLVTTFAAVLILAGCTAQAAPTAPPQPTPQIIYVTPAPTAKPTPSPTPAPTADARVASLVSHITNAGQEGATYLKMISAEIEQSDYSGLMVAVDNFLNWTIEEGIYTDQVNIPECAMPLADGWYDVVSNYGAAALGIEEYLNTGDTDALNAAEDLMNTARAAVDRLDFNVCGFTGASA